MRNEYVRHWQICGMNLICHYSICGMNMCPIVKYMEWISFVVTNFICGMNMCAIVNMWNESVLLFRYLRNEYVALLNMWNESVLSLGYMRMNMRHCQMCGMNWSYRYGICEKNPCAIVKYVEGICPVIVVYTKWICCQICGMNLSCCHGICRMSMCAIINMWNESDWSLQYMWNECVTDTVVTVSVEWICAPLSKICGMNLSCRYGICRKNPCAFVRYVEWICPVVVVCTEWICMPLSNMWNESVLSLQYMQNEYVRHCQICGMNLTCDYGICRMNMCAIVEYMESISSVVTYVICGMNMCAIVNMRNESDRSLQYRTCRMNMYVLSCCSGICGMNMWHC